jgi:hypothetical protein
MRVRAGRTRGVAPAAPSRLSEPSDGLTFQMGEGTAGKLTFVNVRSLPTTPFDAKYSTAPTRLRQHLFFDGEHHARAQEAARRVVRADREESAALFKHRDVRAVIPLSGVARVHGRAVPDAACVVGR